MRRAWAIVLVTFISISLMDVSLFASGETTTAAICCRRDGKHHCAAMAPKPVTPAKNETQFNRELCPKYPKTGVVTSFVKPVMLDALRTFFAAVASHPAVHAQTEALQRISLNRSIQKRGPPVILL